MPVPPPPRITGATRSLWLTFAFVWLVATMLAALLVAASALGMYEAILVAELVALGLLASGFVAWRRSSRPRSTDADRRHRERRGF